MFFAETESPSPTAPSVQRRTRIIALCLLVAVAAGLQLWNFPHRYEVRNEDEIGYLQSGLELLEGMTPSYSRTPAGPFVWMSWFWGAGLTAQYTLAPSAEELRVPLMLRPYAAINHALFDTYRDLSRLRLFVLVVLFIASMAGVISGFVLGVRQSGLAGGLLVGGWMAVLPLFVDMTGMARPYALGWSFGMLAMGAAAVLEPRRCCFWTALFLGLSISSRLEWVSLLPLVWWIFWVRLGTGSSFKTMVRVTWMAVLVLLVIAPWLTTNLIGNVRQVLMARLIGTYAVQPWQEKFWDFFWLQGLIPAVLVWVAGLCLARRGERWRLFLLGGYVGMLLASVFMGGNAFLRYQTAVMVVLFVAAGCSLRFIGRQSAHLATVAVAVCLLLPLAQTIRLIMDNRSSYVPDGSTEWIEHHVPPGTRLYLPMSLAFRDPLPTAEAADYLWDEVTSRSAWEQKWQYGLRRYGLTHGDSMRALSEEGMFSERGNRRGWFLLGGRPQEPAPRYDVRFVKGFTIYGVQDIVAEFAKTRGVVLWRDEEPNRKLGTPEIQWADSRGRGAYIYVSPDLKLKLR